MNFYPVALLRNSLEPSNLLLCDSAVTDMEAELEEIKQKLSEEMEKTLAIEAMNQNYASIIDSLRGNIQAEHKLPDDDETTIESNMQHTFTRNDAPIDRTTQTNPDTEEDNHNRSSSSDNYESLQYQMETLRAELAMRSNYVIKLEAERLSLFGLTDTLRNELEAMRSDTNKADDSSESTSESEDSKDKALLLASSQQTMSELLVARARIQLLEKDIVKQTADIASALIEKSAISSNFEKMEKEMNQMKEIYESQVNNLSNEVESLERSLHEQKEISKLEAQTIEEIRQSMIEAQQQADDMILSLNDRIALLEEERQLLDVQMNRLEAEVEEIQADRRQLSKTLDKKLEENSHLTSSLEDLQRELASLSLSLEASTAETKALKDKLYSLEESMALSADDQSKALSQLQTERDKIMEENKRLSHSHDELEQRLEDVQRTATATETEQKAQIQQLNALIAQLQSQVESLEQEIDSYKRRLETSQQKAEAIEAVELELESTKRKLSSTEFDREQLALSSEHLQNKIGNLTEENERLSTTLAVVRESKAGSTAEMEHLRQELAEYKATTTLKHSALIDELHAARRQYNEETRRSASAIEHRDLLVASAEKIGTELSEARETISELERVVRDLKNEGSTLRVQLTALQGYKTTLTQSLDAAREDSLKYKAQVEEQLAQKDAAAAVLDDRLEELQGKLDELTSQGKTMETDLKREIEKCKTDNAKLIELLQSNQFQSEVISQEKDVLEKRLADLFAEKDVLSSALETAKSNYESIVKESQAAQESSQAEVSALQEALASANAEKERLSHEISALKETVSKLTLDLENNQAASRDKLAELENEISEAASESQVLEAEISRLSLEKAAAETLLAEKHAAERSLTEERNKLQKKLESALAAKDMQKQASQHDYEIAVQTVASLEESLSEIRGQLDLKEADCQRLQDELAATTQTAEAAKALHEEKMQFEIQLKELSKQIDKLRREALVNCAQIIELQEQKTMSENLTADLDEDLAKAKEQIRNLEMKIAATEASSDSHKSAVDAIVTERDDLAKQLEESKEQLSSTQLMVASLQTNLSDTTAELEEKARKVANLKYDQAATKKIIESLQTELEAIKDLLKKSATGTLSPSKDSKQMASSNSAGRDRESQLEELLQMKDSMQRQLASLQGSIAAQMPMTGLASTQTSTESAGGLFVPVSISLMGSIVNDKPSFPSESSKDGYISSSYKDIHAKRSFTTGSPTKSPALGQVQYQGNHIDEYFAS
jgi:chromosome segregation ATPase